MFSGYRLMEVWRNVHVKLECFDLVIELVLFEKPILLMRTLVLICTRINDLMIIIKILFFILIILRSQCSSRYDCGKITLMTFLTIFSCKSMQETSKRIRPYFLYLAYHPSSKMAARIQLEEKLFR